MDVPLTRPYHQLPPFLTRSRSKKANKSTHSMTATRSPSPSISRSRSRSRSHPRSASPTSKNTFSAPPTWTAKFKLTAPLRRSNSERRRTTSTSAPAHSSPSLTFSKSNIQLRAPSTASSSIYSATNSSPTSSISVGSVFEYVTAKATRFFRVGRPRLVNANSPPSNNGGGRPEAKHEQKLRQYYGVEKQDHETVARQRAGSEAGRRSTFREVFTPVKSGREWVDDDDNDDEDDEVTPKASMAWPARVESRENVVLSEGLMKWFRCDIFPSNAHDFHAAEHEARRLVVEDGGKVMDAWTYPGGFMFQIPNHLPCPLPQTAATTPPATKLDTHLGCSGHLRVTPFQPHLDPMQALLQLTSAVSEPTADIFADRKRASRLTALEYLTEAEHSHIEEVPLLRTSPSKAMPTTPRKPRWVDGTSSPSARASLQTWLSKQEGATLARKREGKWYGDVGSPALKTLHEVDEGDEWESVDDDDDDDDGEGNEAKSEFSVETGWESVQFVAQCGGLFEDGAGWGI